MQPDRPTTTLGFTEHEFPAGVHVCQILDDDGERDRSIHAFVLGGLQGGERAACFVERFDEGGLSAFLGGHGLSYDAARVSGRLTVAAARSVYFEENRFDPERLLHVLSQFQVESANAGYSAARIIGEMLPDVYGVPGGSRLLEYESRVTLLLRDHPITTVCQYDARVFDGAAIMDVLKVHPAMVVRGAVIHNPFFIPPEEYLARVAGHSATPRDVRGGPAPTPSARVLGQLSLMQSILASLPDERSMVSFVCRGLVDVPGVTRVRYAAAAASGTEAGSRRFPLAVGNVQRGELVLEVSDAGAFAPYQEYLANFAFMLAVILEERSQRRSKELHQAELEVRVRERTQQLREEIAERQRTEDALRRSEALLRTAFEYATAGVCLLDADGRFRRVNRTLCEMLGYDAAALETRTVHDVAYDEDRHIGTTAIARALAGDAPSASFETRYVRRDGNLVWAWVSTAVIRSAGDEPPYFVTYVQDITERKRAEDALRLARDAAHAANRTKDEFLATVSHELRTPLGPILAWAQMLQGGGLDPRETRDALAAIERNACIQAQLIEDLLDVSRIVAGKLRLQMRRFAIGTVIAAAMDAVRPAALAKGVRIDAAIADEVAPMWGDADRLQQVAWNLLANAIKFTPAGGHVRISASRGAGHVVIAVTDTGQGIPPDILPSLFTRFQQGRDASSRPYGGLGLGLALVRHLVELHGGTVRAESEGEGRGATFAVELPVLAEGGSPEETAAVVR